MNENPISSTDILIGIIYFSPKGKRFFNYDSERFYRFFYGQRDSHPNLLGRIRFDWDGRYPTSPDLSESIENLFAGCMLMAPHSNPSRYIFNEEACECYFSRNLKDLPDERLKEIQDLSSKFQEELMPK